LDWIRLALEKIDPYPTHGTEKRTAMGSESLTGAGVFLLQNDRSFYNAVLRTKCTVRGGFLQL